MEVNREVIEEPALKVQQLIRWVRGTWSCRVLDFHDLQFMHYYIMTIIEINCNSWNVNRLL